MCPWKPCPCQSSGSLQSSARISNPHCPEALPPGASTLTEYASRERENSEAVTSGLELPLVVSSVRTSSPQLLLASGSQELSVKSTTIGP